MKTFVALNILNFNKPLLSATTCSRSNLKYNVAKSTKFGQKLLNTRLTSSSVGLSWYCGLKNSTFANYFQNPLYIIQQTSSNDTIRTKQTLKKLNLWGKTAVDKSAWIKACLSKIYERNVYNQIYLTLQKVRISNATIQYILDTKRLDVVLINLWKLEKNLKKRLLCCLHYGPRWFNPD